MKQDDWDVKRAFECRDSAGERDQACRSQKARLTNRAGDPTVWERDQVFGQLNFRQSKRGQFQQESGGNRGADSGIRSVSVHQVSVDS